MHNCARPSDSLRARPQAQKRQLYHDGFLIIKGALSDGMTGAAQAAIKEAAAAAKSGEKIPPLGAHEAMTGLVNESIPTPLLRRRLSVPGVFTNALGSLHSPQPPSSLPAFTRIW